MKKLYLAQWPQPASPRGLFILFAVAAIIEIALGAGIPLGEDTFFGVLFGSAAAIMTTILPFIFRIEARDKRNWPEKIEAFLNQEVSEKDYQALYKAARTYPAIRAMIAASMKDGKIYYREAEVLVGQINAFLAENSKDRRKSAGSPRQKLVSFTYQRKLCSGTPGQAMGCRAEAKALSLISRYRTHCHHRSSRSDSIKGLL